MQKQKILFLDRDGTLINEPLNEQVDSLQKLSLEPNVIPALLQLQQAGFHFVMVTNQDGLGTESFPEDTFQQVQQKLLDLFSSQGIEFIAIRVCPHFESDNCDCRKPRVGLILDFLTSQKFDMTNCYVIGDRESDIKLANNMNMTGILYDRQNMNWMRIAKQLTSMPRIATINRITKETNISGIINLDDSSVQDITTGIGFFDHMLAQLTKHAGISLELSVNGDLHVDEHHTVEDTALALGQALRQALGGKLGINRYGFVLPMDEAITEVALDLSGRPYLMFEATFTRSNIGSLATELIEHFFHSFAESLRATLHIKARGANTHHMIESIFKGVGRALRMAVKQEGYELPTTKGLL